MAALWIEPFGGMAGDMFLAALLDLEDPRFRLGHLRELASSLFAAEGVRLDVEEVRRGSLRGLALQTASEKHPPHRGLAALETLLERAPLEEPTRRRAVGVLERLAEAEARVHGIAVEAVHFHEVGALDTLVDVAGACLALELLAVERVLASPPLLGSGTVECAHGTLPVPPPATAELLRGLPTRPGGGGERLTPTGAALLAELVDEFDPRDSFQASAIGYGAGERDPREGPPNLLRVQLGGEAAAAPEGEVWELQVNLDDATPEELGFCLAELRSAGALEAWSSPAQMKKDRPGSLLVALCRQADRRSLERVVFQHTPTLGLRWSRHERVELPREELRVALAGGSVRIKRRLRPGVSRPCAMDLSPEFDDLAALAREAGLPLRVLERRAVDEALRRLSAGD